MRHRKLPKLKLSFYLNYTDRQTEASDFVPPMFKYQKWIFIVKIVAELVNVS